MRTVNDLYRERYGCKVYKLSLDGGFTCPNRDGSLGRGGCTFCSADGGGAFAARGTIPQQLLQAQERVAAKCRSGKYIAYFQSFTNTYAPVDVLSEKFRAALAPEEIVGLNIATRPDCLPEDVICLLQALNREKPVTVELGLQTIHDTTADAIRRGYHRESYFDAMARLKAAGLETVTHIILGLPGENIDMAVQTTRAAVAAGTDGIKFHLLHVLWGTPLAEDYLAGRYRCLSLAEYGQWLLACLAEVPEQVVIHRMTGDGAKKDLLAPEWSADKKRVLNYLNRLLAEAGSAVQK